MVLIGSSSAVGQYIFGYLGEGRSLKYCSLYFFLLIMIIFNFFLIIFKIIKIIDVNDKYAYYYKFYFIICLQYC